MSSFRYYTQSQAFFYGPIYPNGAPLYRTSDYRLSPYGAISYGLRANWNVQGLLSNEMAWIFSLGYQRYLTSADWALASVATANPGLVQYHLFSVRVGAKF